MDAISLSNGVLRITTYTENTKDGNITLYTSFLHTKNKFEARYGFFEARIRIDSTPGE